MESVSRSPLLSLLTTSYSMRGAVRAFQAERVFGARLQALVRANCKLFLVTHGSYQWFSVTLNGFISLYVLLFCLGAALWRLEWLVRLDNRVEIRTPESEGAHPGDTSLIEPRPRLIVEAERAALRFESRIRLFHMQGRGQHAVVDGERRLDHRGQPRGTLRMSDLRLDRTEVAARRLGVGEDRLQRLQLGPVSDHGAGAMSFEQPHLAG